MACTKLNNENLGPATMAGDCYIVFHAQCENNYFKTNFTFSLITRWNRIEGMLISPLIRWLELLHMHTSTVQTRIWLWWHHRLFRNLFEFFCVEMLFTRSWTTFYFGYFRIQGDEIGSFTVFGEFEMGKRWFILSLLLSGYWNILIQPGGRDLWPHHITTSRIQISNSAISISLFEYLAHLCEMVVEMWVHKFIKVYLAEI